MAYYLFFHQAHFNVRLIAPESHEINGRTLSNPTAGEEPLEAKPQYLTSPNTPFSETVSALSFRRLTAFIHPKWSSCTQAPLPLHFHRQRQAIKLKILTTPPEKSQLSRKK